MIAQLHKNFRRRLISTTLLTALVSTSAYASDISGPGQITASTSMPIWGGFTVEQIADGIEPGPTRQNGFTTNAKTGTITLDFDQPYDIEGFKLWNDVVLRAEGIKTFRLDFKTNAGGRLSSQIFEAAPRIADVQIFDLPKISGVTSVDLVVLSSLNEPATAEDLPTFLERIEVREVAFTGRASNAAEPAEEADPRIAEMEEDIDRLQDIIKTKESDIRELQAELSQQTNRANSLMEIVKDRDASIAALTAETSALKARVEASESAGPSASPWPPLWGGLSLLALGGLLGLGLSRLKRRPRPKKDRKPPENSPAFDSLKKGMVFSASPMLLGGLPPALAAIKPVYDAVGRIGFAQEGKPIGNDESFGTGILISDRHILTNRHVWKEFKHRLTSDEPTGIEFHGEKGSDKSDFILFSDTPPVFLESWDAAILTLSRPPENRLPVKMKSHAAGDLNDLEIVVVGYPQAHRLTDEIDSVTEKNPIFGVKRYSEGKIFRHSADIENPYGVEAAVESYVNSSGTMRAICHNASTLGGSSGSAIICKKTGELIALHFGFDTAYDFEEAANFAIAGENLAENISEIISL